MGTWNFIDPTIRFDNISISKDELEKFLKFKDEIKELVEALKSEKTTCIAEISIEKNKDKYNKIFEGIEEYVLENHPPQENKHNFDTDKNESHFLADCFSSNMVRSFEIRDYLTDYDLNKLKSVSKSFYNNISITRTVFLDLIDSYFDEESIKNLLREEKECIVFEQIYRKNPFRKVYNPTEFIKELPTYQRFFPEIK